MAKISKRTKKISEILGSDPKKHMNLKDALDTLKKINDRAPLLEIGGSFIDNFGRGYIDSLCRKQYTKKYTS